MGEICRFGSNEALRCILSATKIRGMKNLTITGEATTEEATSGSQTYIKRKSGRPMMVCFEVILSAFTGCNTQSEAISLLAAARDGETDYLYVGGTKLVPCKMMLTKAEAKEFILTAKGKLAHCIVALTFQQASVNDGSLPGTKSAAKASGGQKEYTVFVPGRGTKTVKAASPQAALNAAFPGHTGTYYVDGVGYRRSGAASSAAISGTTAAMASATSASNRVVNDAQKDSDKQRKRATQAAQSKISSAYRNKVNKLLGIK